MRWIIKKLYDGNLTFFSLFVHQWGTTGHVLGPVLVLLMVLFWGTPSPVRGLRPRQDRGSLPIPSDRPRHGYASCGNTGGLSKCINLHLLILILLITYLLLRQMAMCGWRRNHLVQFLCDCVLRGVRYSFGAVHVLQSVKCRGPLLLQGSCSEWYV